MFRRSENWRENKLNPIKSYRLSLISDKQLLGFMKYLRESVRNRRRYGRRCEPEVFEIEEPEN